MSTTSRPLRLPLVIATALLSLATGCAQTSAVQYGDPYSAVPTYGSVAERPLSIGEISRFIQAGRPSDEIVDEIERRGLLAPATEADLDLLLRQGASQEVIDIVQAASQQPPPAVAGTPPATVYAPSVTVVPDYAYPYPYAYGYPWGWGPPVGLGLWYGHAHRPAAPVWRPPAHRPPGVGPRPPDPRPPGVVPRPPRPNVPPGGIGSDNGPPLPGLGGPRRGPDIGSDNGPRPAPGAMPQRPSPGAAPRPFANPGASPGPGSGYRPGLSRPGGSFSAPSSGGFRSGSRGPERR